MLLPSQHTTSEDVPLRSYFGRVVLDHIRTKISLCGMHLASENMEKILEKAILLKMFKLTC